MQNLFIKRRCLARRAEQEWLYLRLNSGFAQLSPWLNSAWITSQLFRAAHFCWSLESQLGKHFTWIHSCFAEDKEEKYFLMRCYWSIVLLQKWNYHSDTNRPLLNVLENKGKPSGWKLGIFPLLSLIDPQWIYVYLIFFFWIQPCNIFGELWSELCQVLHLSRKICYDFGLPDVCECILNINVSFIIHFLVSSTCYHKHEIYNKLGRTNKELIADSLHVFGPYFSNTSWICL